MGQPPWSDRRAWVVILLLVGALSWFAVQWARQPSFIAWPQKGDGDRAMELADRLDPNMATASELAALPGIGSVRAEAIVAYREAWRAGHPGERAFKCAEDLQQVKGIGPATVEQLRAWLTFEP